MKKMGGRLLQIAVMPEVRTFRQRLRLPVAAKRQSRKALDLYSQYLTYAVARLEKKGWSISCGPGCAACCFAMPAGVSAWELVLIYDYLQQGGQLERFFRRNLESCQVLSRVKSELAEEVHSGGGGSGDEYEAILYAYNRARQACAFLSETKECLIYPVRPLACRMHFSSTPAEWCDPAHPHFLKAVRLNFHPHKRVRKTLVLLDEILGLEVGDLLSPGLVTLTANILRFSPIFWVDVP
jgi:Fe-S-cluster containining protein